MKRIFFILLIFSSAIILNLKSSAAPNPVISELEMQSDFFNSSLAPYGEWIEVESGIRVWRPFHINYQWRRILLAAGYGQIIMDGTGCPTSRSAGSRTIMDAGIMMITTAGSGWLMMYGHLHGSSGAMTKTTLVGLRCRPMQNSI